MTLAGIVFGVASIILSGGFIQDIFVQLGEAVIHSQSGHLQIARTGYFEGGSRRPEQYLIERADAFKARVANLPGVDDAMARIAFSGLLSNGVTDLAIVGEGIEPDREARLGSYVSITGGRQLSDGDRYGILLGKGVANALRLAPGDRAALVVSTAAGAMNTLDLEVVGVFQSFSKEYDARAIKIPVNAAQELLDTKGANLLVVSLRSTADTSRASAAIGALLANQGLEVRSWQQLSDFYDKTVKLYDRQFGVLQLIILGMVLLSVTNTVNMTIFERMAEFGTMRALGNQSSDVTQLVLAECGLLGIVGAVLGTGMGIVLATAISAVGIPMPPPPNSELAYTAQIRIVPSVVLSAFAVGVLATALAGVWPALHVARIAVVEALRQTS
jgi:putative ABC transport system permease protein